MAALAATAALAGLVAAGWALWVDRASEPPPPAAIPAPPAPPPPSLVSQPGLPLRGVPLTSPTGLRLLVADAPAPFVLDVDSGETTPITGLPTGGERVVSLVRVGEDALVASYRICTECRSGPVMHYLLRNGSTAATPFARAFTAVGSRDGGGAWLFTNRRPRGCMIREVDLSGRDRRPPLLASCNTGLVAELPGGLLLNYAGPGGVEAYTVLVRRNGREVRYEDWQAQPLVGNLVLSGTDRLSGLTVHDMARRTNRRLSWPASRGFGVGNAIGEPSGPRAIVEFARYSPRHRLDVWVLDTRTRRWTHLPDMPAAIVPKETSIQWTPDGRVVILDGPALGVWRPGDAHIGIRRVKPSRQPGSSFLVW